MQNQGPIKTGDIISGEFKVLDIFGGEAKSGMGVVYLVNSRTHPEPFVIKTFQKDTSLSIQRFRSEAETWVSIGIHSNIVKALFVNEINEQLYIGAEFISPDEYGRNTITHYLNQGGTSFQNIIRWTAQFCYGMEFAISKGLKVHRDIKPDNLMVDEFCNLKITDFGLSKAFYNYNFQNNHLTKTSNPNLTSEGYFLGTILYAAPEQIIDSSSVDFRSDIYSFGIVLYQLISLGGFPYAIKGKTTLDQIAVMHLQEPVIKIQHPLFPLVNKCLARTPKERYQNFKELLIELKNVADIQKISLPENRIQPNDKLKELYIQSFSLRTLGETTKAQQLIDRYLEQDKLDSSAWSLKGRIENELGNNEEAIKTTLVSYQLDPYNSHTCNNLGIFLKNKGDLLNAIRFLTEAIEVDPYNTGALTNLAIALEEEGNYSLAADLIVRAIQLAPDKKTLHFNAGNIAAEVSKQKLFSKAIDILELLVKIDKNNSNNWFNLALNYQFINKHIEAIKWFKIVEQKLPDDEQTLIYLTKINGEIGNYDEAISYCEKLLDKKLSILNAICWRAQFIQAKGNGIEAIEFMNAVISENQLNDHLWVTLANLYANENNFKKAVAMIVRARQVVMENGESDNSEKMDYLSEKQNVFQRVLYGL
jgi:eukaryotic-like serine/threonine-protein kinase